MRRYPWAALGAVLTMTCALVAAGPSPAGAVSPSTIAGTVTSTGAALAHACVTATSTSTNVETSTTTAHNGSYVLTVAPAGYQVRFDDCGGSAGDYVTAYYQQPGDASATTISVATGQSVSGIDANLTPAGSISGQLTDAVSRTPLAGACVSVWPAGSGSEGTLSPTESVTTAADGSYLLRRLLPGAYDVRFDTFGECAGSAMSTYSSAWYPDAGSEGASTSVGVVAELDSPLGTLGLSAASLTGWASAGRAEGICVRTYLHGADPTNTPAAGTAVSDFEGRYAIGGLPTGSYDVLFSAEGGCAGGVVQDGYLAQWYQNALTQAFANPVSVTAGSTATGIREQLPYGAGLSGTVVDAATGTPLSGMCVGADSLDGQFSFVAATTDSLGRYAAVVPASTYNISFADCSGGSQLRETQWWKGTPDESAATSLPLMPGDLVTGVDAAMYYPRAPDEPQSLTSVGGDRQVALSWTPPLTSGSDPVEFYDIYRSEPLLGWVLIASQGDTTYVDTNLSDATSYNYEVTAESAAGESLPAFGGAKTWGVPSAPRLSLSVVSGDVQLSWAPPSSDGGTPITGYDIYRSTVLGSTGTQIASGVTGTTYLDTTAATDVIYTYRVSAVNLMGAGPASPALRGVVASGPPTVTLTVQPAPFAASRSATFAFTFATPTGGPLLVSCTLDGVGQSTCSSPAVYDGLAEGSHSFSVRVSDLASRLNATARATWTVDTTPPSVTMSYLAPFYRSVRIDFFATPSGATAGPLQDQLWVDVRYRSATWNGSFGAYVYRPDWQGTASIRTSLFGRPGRTYCLSARARDSAGNASEWSAEKCTTLPLDDRAFSRSAGWTMGTGNGYIARTWTMATKHGARLTLAGAQVKRLAVYVGRCPTCGNVAVYVNGHYWQTIYTAGKLTTHQWWVFTSSHPLSKATVVLKVVSSGKPVYVDGLGISRV